MSNLRNKVQLIGNLGQDPQFKELDNGDCYARFSIATNEAYKNQAGQKVINTDWHNLIAWNKVAKIIKEHVFKGDEIAIEGKLQSRSYTTDSGETRYVTEVKVHEVLMLGSKTQDIGGNQSSNSSAN